MKNHILIDYENVQAKNLEKLKGHDVKVYVFLGAHQTKMPVELTIRNVISLDGSKIKYFIR